MLKIIINYYIKTPKRLNKLINTIINQSINHNQQTPTDVTITLLDSLLQNAVKTPTPLLKNKLHTAIDNHYESNKVAIDQLYKPDLNVIRLLADNIDNLEDLHFSHNLFKFNYKKKTCLLQKYEIHQIWKSFVLIIKPDPHNNIVIQKHQAQLEELYSDIMLKFISTDTLEN